MLRMVLIGLGVAVGVLVVVIATRPAEFRIARSRTVKAPPDVVFAYVNDFHTWPQWSPWEKLDPAMQREITGAPAGPGATYAWSGNKNIGEGRMTITDARPPRTITIRLEFLKPFAATNTAQFDFVPAGPGTTVTWAMTGRNNFMAKAMSLVMNMDEMIGSQFEQGLATLDGATSAPASAGSRG